MHARCRCLSANGLLRRFGKGWKVGSAKPLLQTGRMLSRAQCKRTIVWCRSCCARVGAGRERGGLGVQTRVGTHLGVRSQQKGMVSKVQFGTLGFLAATLEMRAQPKPGR